MNRDFSTAVADPGFVFEGPHLVAASAGTGKTYSIQSIYARLVAEEGLDVREIQVMTFTEAATSELRDRLRRVLRGFLAFLRDGTAATDEEKERYSGLAATIEARNIPIELAVRRIGQALSCFDSAPISTIHGFCSRALARYAFETGSPFDAEMTASDSALIRRMVLDWRRAGMADPRIAAADPDRMCGYVERLAAHPDATIEPGLGEQEAFLLSAADGIAKAYHAARSDRTTRTFDELLISLRDALRDDASGRLAERLRNDFKAVIVDEFQDTDPVQYEVFRRAFLDVPEGVRKPALFFVGDPKQAIYSFRGGDIYTYRSAAMRKDVSQGTFRLCRNHRATPRLIDAVNLLFMDGVSDDGTHAYTFGDPEIGYPDELESDPSKKALSVGGKDDATPFRIVRVNDRSRDGGLKCTDGVAEAVVESVLSVLAEQKGTISPKDVAILVSSHAKGAQYRDALAVRGVPAVLQYSGNVFGHRTAKEFFAVIKAMALEGGARQVRAALLTSFFDSGLDCLDYAGNGEAFEAAKEEFAKLNGIWREKGFAFAFASLENNPRCDLRRRFAAMPGGERKLADVMQLVDLSLRAMRETGPSPGALTAWFGARIARAGGEGGQGVEGRENEYSRELESERDSVRIMTMHYSKGLEFPVVVVPLPSSDRHAGMDSGPYGYHAPDGSLVYSPVPTERHGKEAVQERTRLLYVALTRATKRTVLIVPENVPDSWPVKDLLENMARNRKRLPHLDGDSFPIAITEDFKPSGLPDYVLPDPPPVPEKTVPAKPVFDTVPSIGSYSSLAPEKQNDDDGFDRDGDDGVSSGRERGDHPVFAIPGGRTTGSCWHAIFEKTGFADGYGAIRKTCAAVMDAYGMAGAGEETVAQMVKDALEWRLDAPDGTVFSLRDIEGKDRFSEWEFGFSCRDSADTTRVIAETMRKYWSGDGSKKCFLDAVEKWNTPLPKGLIKGYVDLLFRHGGYYYVVDWKSNFSNGSKSGFSKEAIAGEMAVHGYFFQYLLYAAVLHRFLKERLGGDYSWDRNFGGIRYFFLRGVAAGCGDAVFSDRPCEAMLDEIAAALGIFRI